MAKASAETPDSAEYDSFEKRLLNDYQRNLPLVPQPFAAIAAELEVKESEVLDSLKRLQKSGVVSRVGATLRPNEVGAGALAAMAVPAEELEQVAAIVDAFPEVNHNYERENELNMWFVVTAQDETALTAALQRIEAAAGYPVLDFPLVEDYYLDLGFELQW